MMAFCIARSRKAFTIAEKLILPCTIDMRREIIGEAAASKLKLVLLSIDTIKRRIVEINDNIECQILERIKLSPYYSIQLVVFTDVSSAALLLVVVVV